MQESKPAAPLRMRRSVDERLADLTLRQQQLEARRQALLAVKKGEARTLDARRKIMVGAAVLAQAERDPAFAAQLGAILAAAVRKPADRTVIADLLPEAAGVRESGG